MNLRKLDHVSFLVRDVERSLRFYSQVLGLRGIPRPRNAGAWLTNDEHSFEVHLIGEAEQGCVTQTLTPYRPDGMTTGHGSHPVFEWRIWQQCSSICTRSMWRLWVARDSVATVRNRYSSATRTAT